MSGNLWTELVATAAFFCGLWLYLATTFGTITPVTVNLLLVFKFQALFWHLSSWRKDVVIKPVLGVWLVMWLDERSSMFCIKSICIIHWWTFVDALYQIESNLYVLFTTIHLHKNEHFSLTRRLKKEATLNRNAYSYFCITLLPPPPPSSSPSSHHPSHY